MIQRNSQSVDDHTHTHTHTHIYIYIYIYIYKASQVVWVHILNKIVSPKRLLLPASNKFFSCHDLISTGTLYSQNKYCNEFLNSQLFIIETVMEILMNQYHHLVVLIARSSQTLSLSLLPFRTIIHCIQCPQKADSYKFLLDGQRCCIPV